MRNKIIKFIGLGFTLALLSACGGGGGSDSASNTDTQIVINGVSQKGPLILGSTVDIQGLDTNLNPTGESFSTQVTNDLGEFLFEGNVTTPYLGIIIDGFFFDELTGLLSGSRIALRSVAEVNAIIDVKVNLLTTLQLNRLKRLILNGNTFENAQTQSIADVLTLFNIPSTGVSNFTQMDITGSTESDAILLASSVILMQMADDLSSSDSEKVARLALILSQLSSDLEFDGSVDPSNTNYQQIGISSQNANLQLIRNNLVNIYASLGQTITPAHFENYVDSDGDGNLSDIPIFTSSTSISVAENTTVTGYTATATDADGDTPTFSLTGGADQPAFSIDADSGVLSFNIAPDYEVPTDSDINNVYLVEITASDGVNSTAQNVSVTVADLDENPPVFTSGSSINVNENTTVTGYTATATDEGTIIFSLTGGADQSAFTIDASSGVLSFSIAPDYEVPTDSDINNVYLVEITASDGVNSTAQSISVTVTDINENPPVFIGSTSISVAENTTVTGYTATATDADGDTPTFSLTGGADQSAFSIDASSGVLNFSIAPDFELPTDSDANNVYLVEITASDGVNSAALSVSVTVTNTNDVAPAFTSSTSISVAENTTVTGYTATATDADGDTPTFSLTGGADQSAFSIDASSGILSFNIAPDYEVPTDSDTNNVYVVEITASDGVNSVAQSVNVTVTDINENPPVFTSSSSISVSENTTVTGYTATATDADGDTPTFSLTGGADQPAFSIDADSGVLSFNIAPDYEVPTDSDTNNVYLVEITATDSVNSTAQSVSVTVVDVLEVTVVVSDIKTVQFSWLDYSGATHYKLFVNPDSVSGYSLLLDNLTGNSTTIELSVHLTDWINARYILEAHDGVGKLTESPLIDITDLMTPSIGYFKPSTLAGADRDNLFGVFGWSVSISGDGNSMAVGAYQEGSNATGVNGNQNDNSASGSGAVYVFTRSGSTWSQQAYLKASNTDSGDKFGYSVSISSDGNTLAVGAFWEQSNTTGVNGVQNNNLAHASGAVYVFTRSGSTWSQQAYLKASNTESSDLFGSYVSISTDGNTLAVGASGEGSNAIGVNGNQNDNSASGAGAVYVFTRSGSIWSQQAYLKASNTDGSDQFGSSLSISADGNTLAVGAFAEASNATGVNGVQNNNLASLSGAGYVFIRSGITWSQQAYLKASNTDIFDNRFGYSVGISGDGNTLVVGAFEEDNNATGVNGNQNNGIAERSGAAYVFIRNVSTWSQQAYLKASNTKFQDFFGFSVSSSADGNSLAVGAMNEGGSGATYVFNRNGSIWSQKGYVKASNADGSDRFGYAVSLNSDGSTLGVGAIQERSNATGINGDQSDNSLGRVGAVYLY